jgi:hypothetical protein
VTGDERPGGNLAIATYLPMRHWWDVPAFLRLVNRIHRQIEAAPGNIAWNARGNPLTKKFYTCSLWRDRPSLRAFVQAEPHATAVRRMAVWSTPEGAFAEWTTTSSTVDWDEAMRRLETPTFYYKKPA